MHHYQLAVRLWQLPACPLHCLCLGRELAAPSGALLPSSPNTSPQPSFLGLSHHCRSHAAARGCRQGILFLPKHSPERLQQGLGTSLSDTARCVTHMGLVRLAGCCLPFQNLQCLPMPNTTSSSHPGWQSCLPMQKGRTTVSVHIRSGFPPSPSFSCLCS